jgi:hypothetical protein
VHFIDATDLDIVSVFISTLRRQFLDFVLGFRRIDVEYILFAALFIGQYFGLFPHVVDLLKEDVGLLARIGCANDVDSPLGQEEFCQVDPGNECRFPILSGNQQDDLIESAQVRVSHLESIGGLDDCLLPQFQDEWFSVEGRFRMLAEGLYEIDP